MDGVQQTVWQRVAEIKHSFRSSTDPEQLQSSVEQVGHLIQRKNPEESAEFYKSQYASFLEFIISQISVDWIEKFPQPGQAASLLDQCFLKTDGHGIITSFLVLSNAVSTTSSGYQLHKVVSLLESFVTGPCLKLLILQPCLCSNDGSKVSGMGEKKEEETLVMFLSSLPDRVLNRMKSEAGEAFYPARYIEQLCVAMFSGLTKITEHLQAGHSSSVSFIAHLLGRLCGVGHGEVVWSHLLPALLPRVSANPIWLRMTERLVSGVPARYMEQVVRPLVQQITWYGHMSWFLGQNALTNHKLAHLLTHKLILHTHIHQTRVLQNIIGHLATSGQLRPLYCKLMKTVLGVWGDKSALKHSSSSHHLYLTQALLVCCAFMDLTDTQHLKTELMSGMMTGLQLHLDSSDVKVRMQGMIVGEALTQALDPQSDHKLKFEYEENEEVKELKDLLHRPPDPGIQQVSSKIEQMSLSQTEEQSKTPIAASMGSEEEELDSDDDLEPFDMSHDQKKVTNKPPVYLRDCMEGLISSEDVDRVEMCLQVAEELIRKQTVAVQEISGEFCKILLHLQPSIPLATAGLLRYRAMVALCTVSPRIVAGYLIQQFYMRNYNVRQRLDMLEVLAAAAQELSSPTHKKTESQQSKPATSISTTFAQPQEDSTPSWREVVEQRIQSKTRRFGKGRTRPEAQATANRFAPVAGDFFFPLLHKFDHKQIGVDLLGEDHLLLMRLAYTLGIIMYAAHHAPISRRMGPALMEFVWMIRYHNHASVRQALLFCTSMIILSTPSHLLFSQMQDEVIEAKGWMQDIVEKDPDEECRKLAIQTLMLLERAVKQEFEASKPS